MTTTVTQGIGRLNERAMLVTLTITGWDGRKLDRKVSKEVEEDKHAKAGHARVHKLLVPKKDLDSVLKAQRAAREKHYELTLPWKDGDMGHKGIRILTADAFQAYMDAMDAQRTLCERAARAFLTKYPQIRREAPKQLGDLYEEKDFPTPEQLEERFTFNLTVDPLPDEADFRVQLVDEDAEEIRQDIARRVRDQALGAERSLWDRIEQSVRHFRETMGDPKKKGWKDTTVSNMHEVARIAPKLTLLENRDLHEVCKMVLDINYSPALLRRDAVVRSRAALEAQAVLDEILQVRLQANTKRLALEIA